MASIYQRQFAGLRPAVAPRLLDPRQATQAHNVELYDGMLRARATDKLVSPEAARTVLRLNDSQNCCGPVVSWDACVWPLPDMPLAQDCHEFTQLVVFPTRCAEPPFRLDLCTQEKSPLLVPAPLTPLVLTRTQAGTLQDAPYAGPDARIYTYTWVDKFGVESPPAPPSAPVRAYDDECWSLAGFDDPPGNAIAVRIYRTTSPMEGGEQIKIAPDTSFQLVEQVAVEAVAAAPYIDCRSLGDLDYGTLLTDDECPPPCMEQVFTTKAGYAVGWSGSDIYFSERYEPWNWPTRYRTTLPHKIVGIAVTGDFVFVGTTGQPFRINTAPSLPANQQAEVDLTIDPMPYDESLPCLGRDTMVSTSFGALYVSRRGLVALQPRGAAQIVSRERIDERSWMNYAPNIGAWMDGKYVGVRSPIGAGIVFDIQDDTEGRLDLGDFVTIDLPARALHMGRDGFLYYAHVDGGVFRFAAGGERRRYTYSSRVHRLPGVVTITAMKVAGDYGPPIDVEIAVDGRIVWSGVARNSKPFRLPPLRGLEFRVTLRGETSVYEWHLGAGVYSLAEEGKA